MCAHNVLLLLLGILAIANCYSYTPIFEVTNRFIETQSNTIVTGGYYGNTSWDGIEGDSVNLTFVNNHSNYVSQAAIHSLEYDIANELLNFTISRCGYLDTGLQVCLYSTSLSQLKALTIGIIVLSNGFDKLSLYTLSYYTVSGGATTFNSANPITTNYGYPTQNLTGNYIQFVYIMGLNITAPTGTNLFDIKAIASMTSASILTVVLETTVAGDMGVGAVKMGYWSFNEGELGSWPFPAARTNPATFSGSAGSTFQYTDSGQIAQDYNTFWGFTRLSISGQSTVQFGSTLTPLSDISVSSTVGFNDMEWMVQIFEFKWCNESAPYYMQSEDLCYDVCPARYYEDTTNFICVSCSQYDCYKCYSNGSCSNCSATIDFRELSGDRCVPITGCFDDGNSSPTAQQCDSNCYTCDITAVYCLTCVSGLGLNGANQCVTCLSSNCECPTDYSQCTGCVAGYLWAWGGICNVGGINCTAVTNCATCNASSGCTQCSSGYSLISNESCAVVCGDGVWFTSEGCDDGNTVAGDGCSASCQVEAASLCSNSLGAVSNCSGCSQYCLNCTSSGCITCESAYIFNNSTQACDVNCSSISLCLTCSESLGVVLCNSCSSGYMVGPGSTSCIPACGDGTLISPDEACDDNNTNNGDGCSSLCVIESSFYCNNTENATSIC